MKHVNRIRALVVCLIILIIMLFESITGSLFLHYDLLAWIYGIAIGWALRDTLESKQEDKE
jgi:hypothetical protein